MKGADIIQIATAVFGLKWFDTLQVELGITDKELSELTKAESIPGPVEYAMRDIATRYMVRVESMQLQAKISDALMAGEVSLNEEALFAAGMLKGMALILAATHGDPEELKALARDTDFQKRIAEFMYGLN